MFSNFFSAFPEPDVLKSIQNYGYFMKSIVDVAFENAVNSGVIYFFGVVPACLMTQQMGANHEWNLIRPQQRYRE